MSYSGLGAEIREQDRGAHCREVYYEFFPRGGVVAGVVAARRGWF